ncbi:unnamed protein product [Dicrocoelium dendriticum]|nr:unnamed protein product [Dicrocoelium dendriticum]
MPTPFLSRTTSHRSPAISVANLNVDPVFPMDWGANVVDFISSCSHPGLVRRTSVAAAHVPNEAANFGRFHRRNLSAVTTIGLGRYPDPPWNCPNPPYPILLDVYTHTNNLNSFHKPAIGRASIFGHSRNISDPTACWGTYRVVDAKHSGSNYQSDYPVYPLLHPSLPQSAASPEKVDDFSTSGDLRSQTSPYLPSWQNRFSELDGVNDTGYARELNVDIKSNSEQEGFCLFTCLQPCVTPTTVLFGLFFIMFVQTMVVSGLISSMLTTLERRFNFTTRQVGYLISCYESSGVLTTVVVSFVNGRKHNRLRIVGLATLLLSLGFALFAVPHFIVGPYMPDTLSSSSHNLSAPAFCENNTFKSPELRSQCSSEPTNVPANREPGPDVLLDERDPVHSVALLIFCVAMVLAGVGASPLHVLAPTYLWDNLDSKQYPIYSALFYSAGGLGPACGFLAGAGFLSLYIDTPGVLPRSGFNRNDPLWLGAWWLGFLVCSALTFVTALPVIAFPKRLITKPKSSTKQLDTEGVQQTCQPPIAVPTFPDLDPADPGSKRALRHFSQQSAPSGIMRNNQTKGGRVSKHRATSESALPSSGETNGVVKDSTPIHLVVRRAISLGYYSPQPHPCDKSSTTCATLQSQIVKRLKVFLLVLRRVLANPIWLGVTFTSMVEQSIVAAFLAYAAKYIQDLFQVPAYLASIHTGAVVVPSSLLGILSGALLMRRYRPPIDRTLAGISVMIGTTVITTISLMLIGCPGNRVAGLTATYDGKPWPRMYGPARLMEPNLTAPCNAACSLSGDDGSSSSSQLTGNGSFQCSATYFNPVCWKRIPSHDDKIIVDHSTLKYMTFFNPCFAGCQVRKRASHESIENFSDCRCTTRTALNPSGSVFSSNLQTNAFGHVVPGRCPTDCPQYAVFLFILFLHILCTGILQNPSNVITLSCVTSEDSSVALGLQLFFMRTLAYIPAPIYFGQLFDLVCQYRITVGENGESTSSSGCTVPIPSDPPASVLSTREQMPTPSHTGACLQYNLEGLPLVWLGLVLSLKLVSLAGATTTWRVARLQLSRIPLPNSNKHTCTSDSREVDFTEAVSTVFEHTAEDENGLTKTPSIVQSDAVV